MRFVAACSMGVLLSTAGSAVVHDAVAQEAGASASFSDGEFSGRGGYQLGDDPFEVGVFAGGMWLKGRVNESAVSERLDAPELKAVGFEGGLRLGAYPIPYVGIEAEGALIVTESSEDTTPLLGAGRGHVVGQLPLGIVAPFILVGGGALGAECPTGGCSSQTQGREIDGTFHFGVGAKLGVARRFHLRLDVRDNIVSGEHLPDALLTAALNFGSSDRRPPPPAALDSDGDGRDDHLDRCPNEPADTPDGCPVADRDGDGKTDDVDQCPDEPSKLPSGCPDPDPDNDGVLGDADKCPEERGVAPDGCPDPDPDRDGILGDADKCPNEPETKNGYDDEDGCADTVPEKVQKFTGVMEGIKFDFGKATIRRESFAMLDEAAAVLQEYPRVKLRITGHTDSKGTAERNRELSKERADAVATYLAGKGIARDRLVTEGHGADKPIADNSTEVGRQENRRIEFEVIQ